MTRFRVRHDDERGATIVLIALSLVALLGVVGVVMDGGFGFSDRRQTQNAADAAALAGANVINKNLLAPGTATPGDVWTAVLNYTSTAVNNTNQTPHCWFINERGNSINLLGLETPEAVAPECSTFPVFAPTTAGVEVTTSDIRDTNFIKSVGINTFTAGAPAKAQVQKFIPNNESGPLMLCAVADGDRDGGNGGVVQESPGPQIPILLPNDSINHLAIGVEYWVKGVEVKKHCGTNGNFKGQAGDGPYPLPGSWQHSPGNSAGPVRTMIAGACNGEVIGCELLIPLCHADPAPNGDMYCTQYGRFQITFTDSNSDRAIFLGAGGTVLGGGGGGLPGIDDLRVVRLTQ